MVPTAWRALNAKGGRPEKPHGAEFRACSRLPGASLPSLSGHPPHVGPGGLPVAVVKHSRFSQMLHRGAYRVQPSRGQGDAPVKCPGVGNETPVRCWHGCAALLYG